MADLPRGHTIKDNRRLLSRKPSSVHSSSLRDGGLWTASTPCCILRGSILCRSCQAATAAVSSWVHLVLHVQKTLFCSCPPPLWPSQSFWPLFYGCLWALEGGWYQCCICDCPTIVFSLSPEFLLVLLCLFHLLTSPHYLVSSIVFALFLQEKKNLRRKLSFHSSGVPSWL